MRLQPDREAGAVEPAMVQLESKRRPDMKLDKSATLLAGIAIGAAAMAAVGTTGGASHSSQSTAHLPLARAAGGIVADESAEYLPSRFVEEARAAKIEPMPPQF
jgi:hypothetical protein